MSRHELVITLHTYGVATSCQRSCACNDPCTERMCSSHAGAATGRVHPSRAVHNPVMSCPCAGGGSGHEPFAAGLVGPGLLSAAVPGDVFASPPAEAVLQPSGQRAQQRAPCWCCSTTQVQISWHWIQALRQQTCRASYVMYGLGPPAEAGGLGSNGGSELSSLLPAA